MRELFVGLEDNGFALSAHRRMLEDHVRVRAFARAFRKTIEPGALVLDAGAGSGILAHLALQSGAGRVIALETGQIREAARRAVALRHGRTAVEWRDVDILDGRLPRIAADVVVCELLGSFGIDEGMMRAAQRLARSCLRPGGTLIPSSVRLFVCPVSMPAIDRVRRFWRGSIFGLPLAPF